MMGPGCGVLGRGGVPEGGAVADAGRMEGRHGVVSTEGPRLRL